MDASHLLKACFLLVPAFLLGCLLFARWRWLARLPAAIALGCVLAFGIAGWLPGVMDYLVSFCIMAIIYSILSLGLNAQWGYNGHLNFGIAGFFAVGAFTMALFVTLPPSGAMAAYAQQWFGLNAPFLVGVAAAGIVSGAVGYLIAQPILHLRADFLAIATLGIAEIIRLIFQNERWLANGPQPLSGITQPLSCVFDTGGCGWLPDAVSGALSALQPRDYSYLYLVIVTLSLAVVYVVLEAMVRSPWGRALRAVRDEEESAAMNGKHVKALRVQSFVLGAVVIGVAGALYAPYMVTIDYSHFKPLFATFLVWVMLMLGGSGNNKGAILGAFVIWAVWSGTGFVTDYLQVSLQGVAPDIASRMSFLRWAFVGLLLALIVLFRPQGILPEKKRVSRFLRDVPED
ncbi:branched-chain amino acid ABC transporter permease [uncultured Castellaniella sp.]|jgi:branched-chain amino acid transport system permease protein|uniref:branched-chain amino acid ABC transporter permease n=1 Tax=uncultured Castellaniella sp. TaxID=647907 RepID=UPI002611D70F|nr:branched-chain amino acid ABC transporter permease [uncultured Castellaniella sp.]